MVSRRRDASACAAPNGTSSQIDRYQPAVKTTTTVKSNLGFKIVGAGVSTCAPLVAPK